jgi:peptidoglycan lytic transglycosylase
VKTFAALPLALLLAACASAPEKRGGYYKDDGPGINPPGNLDAVADAAPRSEPLNRFANKPYQALGKWYTPMTSVQPFRQRGVASWYGKRFHGQKTASGEPYDMYAMTAAHPTLPIPSYVRVTRASNGRSVVVRVNDRGPFHSDRIIDLSYAAAYRLGYVQAGSAEVMIESVIAGEREPMKQAESAVFVQVGAFGSRDNAEALRARMIDELDWPKDSLQVLQSGELWRLHVGPYASREEAASAASRIESRLELKPLLVVR